jgi:hypothetical protein
MKLLILFFLCLFLFKNAIGQSLKLPKELVYYNEKAEEEENDGYYVETTRFHPLGWSKDGKFAYVKFFDAYSDGLSILVVVQDMASDKVIWSKEANNGISNEALWKELKNSTEKTLAQYGIQSKQSIDYRQESWHRINGQAYKFALTTNDRIQINCRAKGLGEKTIFKQDISAEDFEYMNISARVTGIIKSPYENRVIVVYRTLSKGFEFIEDESFNLVGCHLTRGFK